MRLVTTALFAALAIGAPARAEVVSASDDAFAVHAEADVPAERFAVWNALVAPAKWWAPEHTISGNPAGLYLDAQATGCFCELLPVNPSAPEGTRRSSVEHLHVVASIPGSMMRLTGGLGPLQAMPVRGVFTVTLEQKGEGTLLAFDYAVGGIGGKGGQLAPAVDKVVGEQLGRLAEMLGATRHAAKPKTDETPADKAPSAEPSAAEVAPVEVPAAEVPVPDAPAAEATTVGGDPVAAPAQGKPVVTRATATKSKGRARARARG